MKLFFMSVLLAGVWACGVTVEKGGSTNNESSPLLGTWDIASVTVLSSAKATYRDDAWRAKEGKLLYDGSNFFVHIKVANESANGVSYSHYQRSYSPVQTREDLVIQNDKKLASFHVIASNEMRIDQFENDFDFLMTKESATADIMGYQQKLNSESNE